MNRLTTFPWILWIVTLAATRVEVRSAAAVSVDFGQARGTIRALHGVNLGPLCYRGTVDLSDYHRELAVPFTRLHDVVWVNADAVDISTLFPDFRNDPTEAASYDFAATDDYVASVLRVGSKIVYRLGESIEHTPRKYRVHPPSDPERWAAVCLGVIRHYNEGWAQGFSHGIEYWEIWNEPDVRPAMWTGTDEEFFTLYETTAKAIRREFPKVKIGGPALGHVGDLIDEGFQPSAFFTNFLARCRDRAIPLDFFSWHRYTADPLDFARRSRAVRRTLDAFGFSAAESHLNEWNYLPDDDWRPMLKEGQGQMRADWYRRMGGPEGAAFAICALLSLQDAPVDVANYYTGEIQGFGLFDIHGAPKKTYYAFKAFRELLRTPSRVTTAVSSSGLVEAGAGFDRGSEAAAVLIANFDSNESAFQLDLLNFPWPGEIGYEILFVDRDHDLTLERRGTVREEAASLTVPLVAPGVALIKLAQASPPAS